MKLEIKHETIDNSENNKRFAGGVGFTVRDADHPEYALRIQTSAGFGLCTDALVWSALQMWTVATFESEQRALEAAAQTTDKHEAKGSASQRS
jgi:hypothetical protein